MKRTETNACRFALASAKFVLALMLVLFTSATATATEFITDVMLLGHESKTEFDKLENNLKAAGWEVVDYDLNKGAGGAYIHLLYKTENSNDCFNRGYITDFYIKTGKNPPSSLTYNGRNYPLVPCEGSSAFVNSNGDLNKGCGSGSAYIYLFYTKETFTDDRAVTKIYFNDTQAKAVGADGGSTGYDLNTGADGDYIYMHLKTANAILPFTGSGSYDDPYLVNNAADWTKFAKGISYGLNVDKCYKLNADISVATMVGTSEQPFKGTFDGDGHALTVDISGSEQGTAPFHYINGAIIKNLTVGGTVSSSSDYAAGLVGMCSGGTNTITNCAVSANVSATGCGGGMVGHGATSTLTIAGSYYSGTISGFNNYAGGLLGWCDGMKLNLSNCLFKGSFTPASGGKYHPIACAGNGIAVYASTNKLFYLHTVTPTATGSNIIPGAEGIPVSTTSDINQWNVRVTAADGNIYFCTVNSSFVTIGNGTRTTPYYPYHNSYPYSMSQQIYTAEEIGMAGMITSIAFRYTRSFSLEGVQVYMKHTDRHGFTDNNDPVPIDSGDMVFEGTYAATEAGWATIALEEPFEYDGNSNLLVCCKDPMGNISDEDLQCFYHVTGYDSALLYFSNSNSGFLITNNTRIDIQLKIVPDVLTNPANLRVSSCSEETATISWDAPEAFEAITGYAYQYKKNSDAQWSAEFPLDRTTTSATLSGLTTFTDYQFRVKTLYGDNCSSYSLLRFTSAVPLPHDCSFEDGMDGWSMVNCNEDPTASNDYQLYTGIRTFANHSGGKGFQFSSGVYAPQVLISPRLPDNASVAVSFYYRDKKPDSGFWEYFQVGYSTTTSDITAFNWPERDVHYATNMPWTLCETSFPSGTKYIAIRYNSTMTNGLYIDDISIMVHSDRQQPSDLAVSDLTAQSAKLTWEPAHDMDVSGYAYQYKKDTETTWSGEASIDDTSVTLSGLTANTTYDFRLKALYPEGEASNFVATRFMTEGYAVTLPYTYGFEDGMSSWRITDGNLDTGPYSKNAAHVHSGQQSFRFFSPQMVGPTQYLISPAFANCPGMKATFYCKGYASEDYQRTATFQVGYSTKTKDIEDFTWGDQTFADGEWQEYVTFFPSGTKYVAIKRIAGNFLYCDDFSFTPSVLPAVPSQLTVQNLTATSADISWTGDAGTYQVAYRTLPLFYDDFENGIDQWKIVNQGGNANTNWQLHYYTEEKNHYAVASSYDNTTNQYFTVDNWLISPQVNLGGTLKYETAQITDYPVRYEVLVSTTTDDISAFTKIAAPDPTGDTFENVTISLSSYQGQKGYIAFRLNMADSAQGDILGIDDVGIYPDGYSPMWSTRDATGESVTLTGLQPFTPYECNVQAKLYNYRSPWSDVATFFTNGTISLPDNAENTPTIAAIADDQTHDVMLHGRTLYKNVWNTLCLPFTLSTTQLAASPLAGCILKELDIDNTYEGHTTDLDNGTLYLNFKRANSITAGKPYLIMWESGDNIQNPVFTGVTVVSSPPASTAVPFTGGKFTGTYDYRQFLEEDKSILFLGSNNTLYYPLPNTSNPDNPIYPSIGAFRAYFQLDDGITAGDVGSVRLFFDGSEASEVEDVEGSTLNVQRNDAWFTLDGLKLQGKPTRKGLYIRGGRKTVIQ
ncbi:MAG: choice-of-anchor J domain-containing protein [Prevotella sp.]|nr:choice-of-anchor J domain-containing protein [Prevotella sp.]